MLHAESGNIIEKRFDVPTVEGTMDTFAYFHDDGQARPLIVFYMDAPGIRQELRAMGRRFASLGYYVVLPNLYYRHGVTELGSMTGPDGPAVMAAIGKLMSSVTIPEIMEDTRSLFDFLKGEQNASTNAVGAVGYCFSGPFSISAAREFPEQVRAAASICGTNLVTNSPSSPHLGIADTPAQLYFAFAEFDNWVPAETFETVKTTAAGRANVEVELIPGAYHAYVFPERPGTYNEQASEKHWRRLEALFKERLYFV